MKNQRICCSNMLSWFKKTDIINLKFENTPAYKFVEWVAEPSNSVEFFNNETIENLRKMGISKYTISPETDRETVRSLENSIENEIIVYGRTLLMTTEYCTIGTFKECPGTCTTGGYKLKDRMNFEFPIFTDRINCNNLIYNSKITSIEWKDLNINSIRIDILDENIEEINNIIKTHKEGKRLEGKEYTNGNINKNAL